MLTEDLIASLRSNAGEAGAVPVDLLAGIERRTVRRHRQRVATAATGAIVLTAAIIVGAANLGHTSASGRKLPPTAPTVTHHATTHSSNPIAQEVTPGHLSVAATIRIPTSDSHRFDAFDTTFAQSPDGAVFYAAGDTVDVVTGDHAPVVATHAAGPVTAIAADRTDLYVASGRTITDYTRASGALAHSWTITTSELPNQAGLFVEGDTLYVWTDRETARLGFQYATVSRITTSATQAAVIDRFAYPSDFAADTQGLYYESRRTAASSGDYLAHLGPTGAPVYAAHPQGLDAPMRIIGGRLSLDLYGSATSPTPDDSTLTGFDLTTLRETGTTVFTGASLRAVDPAAHGVFTITGTSNSCALVEGCAKTAVLGVPVWGEDLTNSLSVPHASYLVPGPQLVVITQDHGVATVVRITDHR